MVDAIDGKKMSFIRLSAEEFTRSEESQDLMQNNPVMFAQKMRLIPSLDDLAANANVNWRSPDHKNHKLFKAGGFENFRGRVGIDNVIFNFVIRAGKARFGDIFYNLLDAGKALPNRPDGDGKPVVVAIHGGHTMDRKPVNLIKSIYGIDSMEEWVSKQIAGGSNFRVYDIEKANALLQTQGYLAAVGATSDGSWDKITKKKPFVKTESAAKHSERDENSTEYKINTSMTMAEAKRMIETAYRVNNIAEYYEDEYADAEDWLRKAGSDEVEMYIENDFDLQARYINSNEDILNEEYRMADVLEAYLAGTLVGKEKPKPKRLDVSQSTKLKDSRFYSPQKIEDAKATYELAKQKAVGKDANAINRARAEILLFAHNKGAAELLGITQAELNKKLRSWSNYSAMARETTDIQYVYRIYTFIVRFVRMIRYDINCGELKIELFDNKNGKRYHNGYLRVFSEDNGSIYVTNHEVEYGCYKPYIQRFLQFAADNPMYTFYHYPTKGIRYRGIHYSAVDYMNIFSAFEAECHANEDTYENIDASKVQKIKDILVTQLENFPRDGLEKEEIDFIDNARKRITQLGTQFGQSKKIVNAYQVLHSALDGSIKYIFFLPKHKLEGPLQLKDLNRIAGYLAGKRGAVAHGGFSGVFSDVDARKIHFLEILTYAQMLRRMGLDDADIERIVGAIFGCNYVWAQEKYQ